MNPLLLIWSLTLAISASPKSDSPALPIQQGKPHPMACADYSQGKIFLVKFMTGLQRLPNGNTVMTNWLGHGEFGKAPHVIEVTPDKKVVWTFADHETMKTISSIQLLDIPGYATKGEIVH